jgi:anaerobic magnesium-protoporphyrin IX monomethyl ester cyclase
MKVVLTTMPKDGEAISWITPKRFKPDDERMVPLGLLSLASNLPRDVDVIILDPPSRDWTIDRTVEEIEKMKPDVLGLSVVTIQAYPMVQILKRTSAPYKAVGGPHATHYADIILRQGADAVFVGPLADREFARAVTSRPKGKILCRTRVDEIKFPNRTLVDLDFYYPPANLFKAPKRVVMFSSIGCPYRCVFCDVQTKKVQRKTAPRIVEEMIYLRDIGAGSVHILDDCFNAADAFVRQILAEMDRRDFRCEWSARGKPVMDPETARMLKDRGFRRIHVGMESLSDETLAFFNKPYRYADIETFCRLMNATGIDTLGYFITGAPTETPAYRKSLAGKIRELGITHPYFNILMALPNTKYYDDLLRDGVYDRDYWQEYVENPVPDFMLPFPFGEARHRENVAFVTELIEEFRN